MERLGALGVHSADYTASVARRASVRACPTRQPPPPNLTSAPAPVGIDLRSAKLMEFHTEMKSQVPPNLIRAYIVALCNIMASPEKDGGLGKAATAAQRLALAAVRLPASSSPGPLVSPRFADAHERDLGVPGGYGFRDALLDLEASLIDRPTDTLSPLASRHVSVLSSLLSMRCPALA